jgi:hypothetical protein
MLGASQTKLSKYKLRNLCIRQVITPAQLLKISRKIARATLRSAGIPFVFIELARKYGVFRQRPATH